MGEQVLGVFFFFSSILASSTHSHIHGINGIYYDEFCNKCSNKIADRNKLQKGQCRTNFYSQCLTEEPAATTVVVSFSMISKHKNYPIFTGRTMRSRLYWLVYCISCRSIVTFCSLKWFASRWILRRRPGQFGYLILYFAWSGPTPHHTGSFAPPLFYSIAAKLLPK